jgi:hypothetical protein
MHSAKVNDKEDEMLMVDFCARVDATTQNG